MSFLSAYSGTKRVSLGDPSRGYWVELREHVTVGAREAAERALTSSVIENGKLLSKPDVTQFRQLTVLAAIENWNLDDDGQVWPVTLRNIQRLPGDIFDELWQHVNEMQTPRSAEERQQFPDGGVISDQDEDSGTTQSVDVPDRAAALEAPGVEA